ncbi:uncharacterized protein AB675_10175 [Cyphellophora attinorum]|uniref:Transcription factor domain-containing protein n=1 Tax=Cyphellophora attinorum TaxID=1664694 RepID=A0A0N1HL66_9EURO|nr:uncharacterized protein AB675_10175 [Phialophora attinorum]KPI35187.1 hypothetical protein AB675_10175 [Phialophora attinorum]
MLKGMPLDVFHAEPFNAYPIPTIGVVHRMAEHFLRVWAPQQGHAFAIDGHPNPYLSLLWPYALQDAAIFEGIIAMCRASWLLENGQDTLHDRGFNYHFNNSKQALQRRLDNPDTCYDDTTLLSIMALTTVDYTLGEHSLAEQYLQSMRQMVTMRGGHRDDTDWNRFLTAVCTAFEMLWSFILSNSQQNNSPTTNGADKPSEAMRNAIPVYANHPFPPDYTASLARIPQGFSDLAVSSLLSMQCVRVIERIPFTPSSAEATANSPRPDGADLHTIHTDLLKLTTLKTTKMEHVLCFGLVAYCLPLQCGRPLPAGCTSLLQSCVDAYMRFNLRENEEKLDGKCLLWIAVVLASALDNCADEAFDTHLSSRKF